MRWVARVAVAFAMAVTLSVSVDAKPAKKASDGGETIHRHVDEPHVPFLFDGDLLPEWKFPPRGLFWPPAKKETAGPEQLHMQEQHFLIFSGSDVWPQWAFAHAGVLWSPDGLSNEGFTVKALANGGAYRYISGALNNATVLGRQSSITVMPGWRFKRSGYEVTVFAGVDVQQFQFIPVDPRTDLRGLHLGLRAAVELWHEPTPTTMLAADASVSSISAGNSVRAATGWRVFDSFYLGPEAQAFTTGSYVHTRVGIHVTALKIDGREMSGAVGLASDNDNRSGMYLRINVLKRR